MGDGALEDGRWFCHDDRGLDRHRGKDWIVLLEAVPASDGTLVELWAVWSILEAMGDLDGVALYAPDRIAVQVPTAAVSAAGALSATMNRWEAATLHLGPAGWDVVRAEVLTSEEFQADLERA